MLLKPSMSYPTWGSARRNRTWQLTLSAGQDSKLWVHSTARHRFVQAHGTRATGLKARRLSICEKRCSIRKGSKKVEHGRGKTSSNAELKNYPNLRKQTNLKFCFACGQSIRIEVMSFFTLRFMELWSKSSCIILQLCWKLSSLTPVCHHLRLLRCVWKWPQKMTEDESLHLPRAHPYFFGIFPW